MKKDAITFPDFMKLDFRIGKVLKCEKLENSEKLLELVVDLGPDYGEVAILTGLAQFYTPEDFIGKNFMFLANLEPKPMAGKVSNGMLFAADGPEKPILIEVSSEVVPGTILR